MIVATAILTVILQTTPSRNPASYTETIPKSAVKFEMVRIPGGTLGTGEKAVAIKPFYMAKTETVWEMFDAFLLSGPPSPSYDQTKFGADAIARPSKSYILPDLGWGHAGYPVINVSSTNVEMFTRWLSSVTGRKYRLPSTAEWEWACRAGVTGPWKLDKKSLATQAWYAANSKETTHPVGKKAKNAYGLFDMLGNAGEWAYDSMGDPVLCGGHFRDKAEACNPETKRTWAPAWQETDPQLPKSRWWLSDGPFAGFRLVTSDAP